MEWIYLAQDGDRIYESGNEPSVSMKYGEIT
jgi:hypothetical protein